MIYRFFNTKEKFVQAAKYYNINLDCTLNISEIEEIIIIIHFVNINTQNVKISEHFLDFVPVLDTTGLELT